MRTLLDTMDHPAHDSYIERNSEFIGNACHIDGPDDIALFVERIRDQHPKARHVAFAAVWGEYDGRLGERMSDDGEPSGTAGKPILDVLRQHELTDCVVTVTRYFGGILLGSGGLIRAYAHGASLAVQAAQRATIVPCRLARVRIAYNRIDMMRALVTRCGASITHEEFAADVTMTLTIPQGAVQQFDHQLREQFNATVTLELGELVHKPVLELEDGLQ